MEENYFNNLERPTTPAVAANPNELKALLEQNLHYSKLIYANTQKIRRFMFWRLVFNIIAMIILLAPLIVALVYLPPVLRDMYDQYQQLMGGSSSFDFIRQLNTIK